MKKRKGRDNLALKVMIIPATIRASMPNWTNSTRNSKLSLTWQGNPFINMLRTASMNGTIVLKNGIIKR
jgi:hypothetical protein